jgi:murein DD-endopeptidase MepM/ murein hydrolase activator NlpD
VTGKQIDRYLRSKGSPLAGQGHTFVRMGRKYGVDPALMVAISGAETSFGKAGNGPSVHNAWGIGPGHSYGSWTQGIASLAKLLRTNYLDKGYRSLDEIGARYVYGSNDPGRMRGSDWIKNVRAFMDELGGDPGRYGVARGKQATAPQDASFPTQDPLEAGLDALRRGTYNPLEGLKQLLEETQAAAAAMTNGAGGASVPQAAGPGARGGSGHILGGAKWNDLGGPAAHGASGVHIWQNDNAVDLGAPVGTPIYAVRGGKLCGGFGESNSGPKIFGKRLTICSKGNAFFYTHMGRYAKGIHEGATVRRGQLIGFVGAMPGGPSHLHFAAKHGDPYSFFGSRKRRRRRR